MRRTGLLAGETTVEHYRSWHPEDVAARWFHACGSPDLDLGCSFVGWFCTFDDQFDSTLGHDPQAVEAHIATLHELLYSPPLCFLRSCNGTAGLRARHGCSPLSKG
ncbi:hypothetical protein [Streptomyces guryensis]|uniref:Uncharacterized protein n=1 Tax=Streptomyces guryensis TaxID=2886947 RepID=A0A9Q3Z9I0_9ACTN|nr:hypothetical protein [Streptomyces guryensis]MCD9874365.1 hypothetical protein [Streptomyces guryensis]